VKVLHADVKVLHANVKVLHGLWLLARSYDHDRSQSVESVKAWQAAAEAFSTAYKQRINV